MSDVTDGFREAWVHPSFGMTTTQDIRDLFAQRGPLLFSVNNMDLQTPMFYTETSFLFVYHRDYTIYYLYDW